MKLTKTMTSLALAFTVGLSGVATTSTTFSPVDSIEAKAATTIAYKAKLFVNSPDGNVTKKKVVGGATWLYGTASGKKGWMNAKYLSSKKVTQVSNSSNFSSAISYGARFLGTPYVWGGTTPSGFDCSGFTSYVYRNALGKSIPRTSGAQYTASKKISKSQLQVGDLVFFNTSGGGVSHVSIYAGNNKLLHAAGKQVKYSNLYDGYWNKRIVGYGTFR